MTKQRILVTGSAGFLGSHLYEKLKKDGHEVIGIDNWFHACKNPIVKEVKYADIRYSRQMDELIKWCDTVLHLAAQIHVDRSIDNPQETIDINVTGTLNILEAVRKYDKQLVFASSSEVYGSAQTESISETHPLDAQSPYAASKVAGDRLCKSYYDTYNTKVAILRNFNTFGAYQNDGSYGGVIAIFVRKALRGEPLEVYGDGSQQRDYMHVSQAIRGYEFCIERQLFGKPINIGTGSTIQIQRLAEMIKELTNSNSEIINVAPRPGEVMKLKADTTFAQSLGFNIEDDFKNKLRNYVDWYRESNF